MPLAAKTIKNTMADLNAVTVTIEYIKNSSAPRNSTTVSVISRKNGKGSSLSLKSIHLGSTVFFIPKIINVKAGIVKCLRHVAYTLA